MSAVRSVVLPNATVKQARDAAFAFSTRSPPPRRERLSGIHNPWGPAATLTKAWSFIDLCESDPLVDAVASIIGPDVILWDSELYFRAAEYAAFVNSGREGRYWPMETLAGAVAIVSLRLPATGCVVDVTQISTTTLATFLRDAPLYVIRYMPATMQFSRDPNLPANWRAMEEQPLINYTARPLWLVRGQDRAKNDFVTGFSANVPQWASR